MQLIVLGIEQMNPGLHIMKPENLLLKGNELISFFGIAGNRNAGNRKLKSPLGFNGGGDNSIVAEDFLSFVWIRRFASDADTRSSVIGKFGTAEAESIGSFAYQG
jgi:hypothetical protein